jgi:amino acid transporter
MECEAPPRRVAFFAWVSARYLCVLLGWDIVGPECLTISFFFLMANFALNTLSPKLGGKFQVTTTVIKLIPLILMAVVGTIVGLTNGITIQNLTSAAVTTALGNPLFAAIVSTAFAYEGWIVATSINTELKDAKRNLPKALLVGATIIMIIYVLYYIGIAGALLAAFWLLYFYGANLTAASWFWRFSFDTSELPIVTIYALYIPILITFMMKEKEMPGFRRFAVQYKQ